MDVWTTLPTLVRLIKAGQYSGPVFESKGCVITSIGALTVIATKVKSDRIFKDSVPLIRAGYYLISTGKEEAISPDDAINMLLEYAGYLEPEDVKRLIAELQTKAELQK